MHGCNGNISIYKCTGDNFVYSLKDMLLVLKMRKKINVKDRHQSPFEVG